MRNGDFRPFWCPVSLFRSDAPQPSPGSGDGKIVGKAAKPRPLGAASGNSQLNKWGETVRTRNGWVPSSTGRTRLRRAAGRMGKVG